MNTAMPFGTPIDISIQNILAVALPKTTSQILAEKVPYTHVSDHLGNDVIIVLKYHF